MKNTDDYLWDPYAEPDEEVLRFERALREYKYVPRPLVVERPAPLVPPIAQRVRRHLIAVAASLVLLFIGQLILVNTNDPWQVHTEAGRVAVTGVQGPERLRAGSVVATSPQGRARVRVGNIGDVYMAPETEVEVVRDDDAGHRLRLRHGEIHARIWSPARFFVVDTRFATATDLGCVYNLRVNPHGDGKLEVLQGAVELAHGTDTVYVASGISARVNANGIGTPRPMTSSDAFSAAVDAVEGGRVDDGYLSTLLRDPSAQSSVSLWYLLPKLPDSIRTRFVARIAQLVPLPDSVGALEHQVVSLDPAAMAAWEGAMKPHWAREPNSAWRRFLVKWRLDKPVVAMDLVRHRPVDSQR